ncbi:MAG: type II toxin-antitoxin system HicA family toxin [Candidatus Poribacteria bacterium]|nr:type II toxin-antitoxin system HicA family toxin [Candidatus Poribacteria bacterium]
MKIRELIKLVEADGWYQVRRKGSHRQFKHLRKKGADVRPGTLNNVLKQAGIK